MKNTRLRYLNARADLDAAAPQLQTRLLSAPAAAPRERVPQGMVERPTAKLDLKVDLP